MNHININTMDESPDSLRSKNVVGLHGKKTKPKSMIMKKMNQWMMMMNQWMMMMNQCVMIMIISPISALMFSIFLDVFRICKSMFISEIFVIGTLKNAYLFKNKKKVEPSS